MTLLVTLYGSVATMPIPETLLRWFESDLAPGETARAAANADLWLRYRRLVLTDPRLPSASRPCRHDAAARHGGRPPHLPYAQPLTGDGTLRGGGGGNLAAPT